MTKGIQKIDIGKGIIMEVDWDKLPETTKEHAMYLGIKGMLRDSTSDETLKVHKTEEKQREASLLVASAKLARMYAGDVNGTGGRTSAATILRDQNTKLAEQNAEMAKKLAELEEKLNASHKGRK